ncbi:AbrB/MazE/SpoVT family DNA-binding domain-containing protein [Candidatus Woesearchaeota archaeon]|nr:AbrB/MazE/SpoVT family DNA-binding domain-containing protein [Candidatus Woesearchaeota archaeon]
MKTKKCYECNGEIVSKKIEVVISGKSLGKFPAEVCKKCGEEVFDELTSKKIDKTAKQKGLWGLAKKIKIVKLGRSLAIKIPKRISDFLGLREGKEALIKPEKNTIIIEN